MQSYSRAVSSHILSATEWKNRVSYSVNVTHVGWHCCDIKGGPNGPIPSSFARPSLDHLVGALQQRLRHGEAKRLGGLQVDDQLELDRLLHRQVGGLGPFEDLSGVNAELAKDRSAAR